MRPEPPAWPGTATWTAKARAETVEPFADRTAPAEPTAADEQGEPEGYWGEAGATQTIIKHRRDAGDRFPTSRLA